MGRWPGVRRFTAEGLYGRRKMTALIQRGLPAASPGSVDWAMKALGLNGIRRSRGIRTTIPAKDGRRAGDLLNKNFTECASNCTCVAFVHVSFIVDEFAQKFVTRQAATCKDVELVMAALGKVMWKRQRERHSIKRD